MTNKHRILIGAIVLAVLGIGGLFVSNRIKTRNLRVLEHNLEVALDSLKVIELKNGDLLALRGSYILSEKDMTKQLELSKAEAKDLRKKLGSAIWALSKVKAKVVVDTVEIPSVVYIKDDSTRVVHWNLEDQWMVVCGTTEVRPDSACTVLNSLGMDLPLTIGYSKDHKFFVSTPNPYVQVTDITSTVNIKTIRPRTHWGIGFQAGPGVYWNPTKNSIDWGLGLQFGVSYRF